MRDRAEARLRELALGGGPDAETVTIPAELFERMRNDAIRWCNGASQMAAHLRQLGQADYWNARACEYLDIAIEATDRAQAAMAEEGAALSAAVISLGDRLARVQRLGAVHGASGSDA